MSIQLEKENMIPIIRSLKRYIEEEFEIEVSDFQTKLLLEFVQTEIAPFSYNKGVSDAEKYFRERLEDLSGTCFEHGLTYWNKNEHG